MDDTSITRLLDATRLGSLHTTRSGRILAQTSALDAAGTSYVTALHELIDGAFVQLTRGSASIGSVAAAEDGTTLFTAKRVGEDGKEADDAQLWALPVRGEAREIASRPGGFGDLHIGEGVLVAELEVHSQATSEAEHAELSAARKDAKVTAALHSGFPTRFWSTDVGPGRSVLAVADLPDDLLTATPTPVPDAAEGDASQDDDEPTTALLHFRHVAMPEGRLIGWHADAAGTRALVTMKDSAGDLLGTSRVYLVDLTGASAPRRLLDATEAETFSAGELSPSGARALIGRHRTWTATSSAWTTPQVLDLAALDAQGADATPEAPIPADVAAALTPVWPEHDYVVDPEWLDEDTLVASSDDQGRGSVWLGGLTDAAPRRIAGGPEQRLSFSSLAVAGSTVVASASGIDVAPHPVTIDPAAGTTSPLPSPADAVEQSGSLTELTAAAADGTTVRSWLRLPDGEGPHPLVVFAHGGPWGSWNAWTYRWNPDPFVAAGYAVLLPDPAISTGYGEAMIDRGQHELGGAPFTDIMALTDAAVAREDIDAERTAFAGGSYGGYMANWVAGHTGDRFRCVVTHASLWDTETMGRTTDNAGWERPMRPQNPQYNPSRSVAEIQVPMLVIHGDKDYRVPIAQGQALWYDLLEFSATPKDEQGRTRHRYLYFPDEGHWILGRGNAEVWYRTVLAFLDEHVRGESWERPATLG